MKRFIVLVLFALSCASHRPTAGQPDIIQRASVIASSDRMAAIRLLEDELKSGRNDPNIEPWVLLWAGEQRRLSGDLSPAREWFQQLALRYPTHSLKDPAILGMAMVDSEATLSGNTLATLQLMDEKNVPDSMNADRFKILALVGANEGTPMVKVRAMAQKAVKYATPDPGVLTRIESSLAQILSSGDKANDDSSDKVKDEVADATPGGTPEEIALKRSRAALASGDFERAKSQASDAAQTWPASSHLLEFSYIQRRAATGNPTHAGKVGVLLPETGDYAPAAKQLKEVIQLANAEAGSPITLIFGDTRGTAEGTTAEIERLVIDEGCVAILGPLLKANGDEAAVRAQALRTPIVTLTQGGDPTSAGPFAFRGFMTLRHQIDALLDHAFDTEGHQRIAVLHPENGYGESARDIFTASVTQRGGEITKVVSYPTDTNDFTPFAKELTDKNEEERADELYELRESARERGLDPRKVTLPPLVSFDAIFIPDNHRRLVLVTSSLAYEEIPVGAFRKHVDEEPVQLLGLNAWNHPQLVLNGGKYVQDSIFVDAFWAQADDDEVKEFINIFNETVERAPRVIDALTWDATRLLTAAVLEGGDDRDAIQQAMSQIEIDDPVAGGERFNPDREVDRRFHIMTIKKDGIQRWTPSPPSTPEEADFPAP